MLCAWASVMRSARADTAYCNHRETKKTFLSHLTIVERFYILPFSFFFRHQKSNLSADRAAPRQKYVGGWHGTGTPLENGLNLEG